MTSPMSSLTSRFHLLAPALALLLNLALDLNPSRAAEPQVLPGVEVLARERADELKGKRVGILTNPTGVDFKLESTVDVVRMLPGVEVVRLFAPEHGLRGGYYAGIKVDESRDPVSGLPIASLYGKTRRPSPEMLKDLDVVIYDIQDTGVRHYTYISSLTYMMEACEPLGVEVWVLDRPEPMGGALVGGPMLESRLRSFIGIHEIPLIYGMTPGEFAKLIQAERTPKVKLRVIPMKGWKRGMLYGDLGWVWVPPSQHIPRWESCIFYAMTGTIGEAGTVSEGVGVPIPFELLGGPTLDGMALARELNKAALPGVLFRPTTFTPRYGGRKDKACQGVQIHLVDPRKADPARTQLELMAALNRVAPGKGIFAPGRPKPGSENLFLQAIGDSRLAQRLADGGDPRAEEPRIRAELDAFKLRREKHLLYP